MKFCWIMAKLCCFNQDNPHFSCHAELSASRFHWNSPDHSLGNHIWTIMSGVPCWTSYHKLQPKPKVTGQLNVVLQTTWKVLPQEH